METFKKTLMVLSMALGLAACTPEDGPMMSSATGGHAGTAGGVDAGATPATAPFIGRWQYPAGTGKTTFTCDDGTTFDVFTDGTERETFTPGPRGDQVVATDGYGCAVTCTVTAGAAACQSTQICDGVTLSSDIYTVIGDALRETAAGFLDRDDGTHCTFDSPENILMRLP